MASENPIARKVSAYLDGGRLKKPKAKVIAHIYPDIMQLRDEDLTWAQIHEIINSNKETFTVTYETLIRVVKRIKAKGVIKVIVPQESSLSTNVRATENKVVDSLQNPALKKQQQESNKSSIDEYLKVCFNNEMLAKNAIEADISIEEIKSWQCPNLIRLSNSISNYASNK